MPIICPTNRRGESFVMDERPTGLREQLAEGLEEIAERSHQAATLTAPPLATTCSPGRSL